MAYNSEKNINFVLPKQLLKDIGQDVGYDFDINLYDDIILSGNNANELADEFEEHFIIIYGVKLEKARKQVFKDVIKQNFEYSVFEYDFIKMAVEEKGKSLNEMLN